MDINHCEFCGHKACKKCAYKMRLFANQSGKVKLSRMQDADLLTMQRVCKMGRVCRICDRKFFLRASFEKHIKEINHYTELEAKK